MCNEQTILVVDENEDNAKSVQRALAANQIANPARVARDGRDAAAYLEGTGPFTDRDSFPPPCAIFTELKAQRGDGFEFLEWLHRHPAHSSIPVVAFCRFDRAQDMMEAFGLGVRCFLAKPAGFDNLAREISAACENWSWCQKEPAPAGAQV